MLQWGCYDAYFCVRRSALHKRALRSCFQNCDSHITQNRPQSRSRADRCKPLTSAACGMTADSDTERRRREHLTTAYTLQKSTRIQNIDEHKGGLMQNTTRFYRGSGWTNEKTSVFQYGSLTSFLIKLFTRPQSPAQSLNIW